MIEIEYKFLVKNKKALIKALNERGKLSYKREYQSNVMFDNADGLMQKTDGRIRLRVLGESGKKVLTYKKPLLSKNGAKREIEHEIEFIDSNNRIEKILKAMEFMPTTSYERYRTEWRIKDIHITLDEYPYSNFIEIEGAKKEIEQIAKEFGFNPKSGLTSPADTLFQYWRKARGLGFKSHMRFNDFNE